MNAAFGTDIDLAAAGTALADSVWSGFGYTVDGPTIADVRAETIQAERQAEDDADRDRFRDRGDDADNNGFADYGDPRGTVDPNDPTDTGGSGLL